MTNSEVERQGLVRPMSMADVESVLVWRNDPQIRRFMFSNSEIPLDKHLEWFKRSSVNPNMHLLIYEDEGLSLGFVSFLFSNGQVADWSLHTSPSAPKGTGAKMGRVALNHAFRELSAHKVCGRVISYNARSIGMHKKLGFIHEGVLREQHYDGRQYHAVHCFGMICTDWSS